jgi:chemotaxis protein MotB
VRAALLLLCGLLATASGCVTRGTYREVQQERDQLRSQSKQLQERVRLLEASNESLDKERLRLIDKTESLRETRESLEKDVKRLRQAQSELSQNLAERETQLEDLRKARETYQSLVADLESEVAAGQIEIEQLREGVRLNVSDEILFDVGSAELGEKGRALLQKVAKRLAELPNPIEVQGHTDDLPIRGGLAARYPTNWELAGARAARVARLLEDQGVAAERLTAVSYGEYHPVAPNDTPEGRALNRRIEIRLLPTEKGPVPATEVPEPGAAADAAQAPGGRPGRESQ